jgi:hypothetical protein
MNMEITSIEKDIRTAEEIIIRSIASKYYNYNGILIGEFDDSTIEGLDGVFSNCDLSDVAANDNMFIIIPDQLLLMKLLENKYLNINELPISDPLFYDISKYVSKVSITLSDMNDNQWIPIHIPEQVGKMKIGNGPEIKFNRFEQIMAFHSNGIEINIKDSDKPIIVNDKSFNFQLKISECNNFKYHVFVNPLRLAIRKDFKSINEGYGFSIINLIILDSLSDILKQLKLQNILVKGGE